ncbi:MAG: thiamine-phosphate kinase [Pseudomonadales bacterium]|nr:thiamine-phosphate kinase [Pseudomonadales bacterium]
MSLSEFEIIQKYFQTADLAVSREEILLGIGDDSAILSLAAEDQLLISTDVLVDSVHFPSDANPEKIATRALAVNLSDLAAMGAEPLCFTLGLVLADASESWLQQFSQGLIKLARQYNIALIGGDLSKGPTTIAIQVHGIAKSGKALRRDAANVGDLIFVTGCLGDGAIALASMGLPSHLGASFQLEQDQPSSNCASYFEQAYFEPQPRIEFALQCGDYISSAIDISDGLIGDIGHICTNSRVGAALNVAEFPYSDSATCCVSTDNLLRAALFGGDDYELCVTVAKHDREKFQARAEEANTRISCIGEITEDRKVRCYSGTGEEIPLNENAYRHFQEGNS